MLWTADLGRSLFREHFQILDRVLSSEIGAPSYGPSIASHMAAIVSTENARSRTAYSFSGQLDNPLAPAQRVLVDLTALLYVCLPLLRQSTYYIYA